MEFRPEAAQQLNCAAAAATRLARTAASAGPRIDTLAGLEEIHNILRRAAVLLVNGHSSVCLTAVAAEEDPARRDRALETLLAALPHLDE
jgi:hypothetical protein